MTTPSKPSAWPDAYSRRMGLGLVLALALLSPGCAPKLGGSENASITTTTGNGQAGDPGTDFTLAVSQSEVTVPAGGHGSNGVSVAWINCAPASIQLDPDGLPQGLTVAFNANPTPDLSSLTVAASAAVPAGTYPIRLLGKAGAVQHDAKFDLIVPPAPGFALALSPASLDVPAGGSGKLEVAIQRLGGFTDPVALSLTGAPSGVTGTFTTVPVPAAPGGLVEEDHTLLLSVDGSVQPGLHTLTVHGASGGVDHAVSFFLKISPVTDFTFALSPAGITANQTDAVSGASTITLTRAAGFTGAVTFTATGAPAGVTPRFTPNPVAGGSASLDFLMNLPQPGAYPIHVTGQSGTVSHAADLVLTVNPGGPDFQVTAPATATADLTGLASGTKAITLPVGVSALAGFNRPVALSASGLPAGVTAAFSPASVTPTGTSTLTLTLPASTPAGTSTLTITGDGGSGLTHTATLRLTVVNPGTFTLSAAPDPLTLAIGPSNGAYTGTATVSVAPANGFSGSVTLAASGLPPGVTASLAPDPTTGTSTVTFTATLPGAAPGSYPVTLSGTSGALSASTTLTLDLVAGPDFSLSATPNPLSIQIPTPAATPASGQATVTVTPLNGYAKAVTLSATGLPAGVTAAFAPNPSTGASTLTFQVADTAAAGSSTVTLTGTDGTLTHSATLTLTLTAAQNFTLSLASGAGATVPGGSTADNLTLTPANGFASNVALSLSGAPAGITAAFSPTPVTSASGYSSKVTFSVAGSVPAGTYPLTIQGTGAGLTRSVAYTLTVRDFTLSATPNPLSIQIPAPAASPATGQATVTVTALNGYASPLTFNASGLPAGVTAAFTPNPATGSSTLTFQVADTAAVGSSLITVTGSDGTLTHSATLTLTLTAAQNFTLGLASGAGTTVPGGSTADNLTLTPANGFASDVALSLSGAPAGITAAFSPTPVTSASGYSSKVTFSVAGSVPAGTYTLTVQGTGAGLTRTVAYTLTVQDFTLSATPDPLIVVRGARTPSAATLTQTAASGFAGTVNLSVTTTLPAGLSVSLSPSAITGTGTATISASATAGLATGDYPVTLQGVDSATGLTRTTTLTLRVQDFALTTSSPLIFHGAQGSGSTGSGTVTLSALNGYAGTVSLTATPPAGLSFTPSPASLTGSGTSTLQAQVTTRLLPAGLYTGSVSGTDTATGIVHSAPFNVVVEDYTLAAGSATTTGTFSWGGSGTMALDLDPAATGFPFDESITWSVSGTVDSTGTPVTYWAYTITPNPTSTSDTGITLAFSLAPPATGVPAGTYYVTVRGVSATSGVSRLATFTITVL